ncbi:MAG: hypothetical protein NTV48_01315 [Candidatus Vogelbacteria bacterium]|nr:hypothetical protein [Candidatus Vogelbacteria bacterium]
MALSTHKKKVATRKEQLERNREAYQKLLAENRERIAKVIQGAKEQGSRQ